jgi:poly(A) polymerase
VEPLGRHARVAFIDDWRVDAERRDFTMNALFLDPGGTIIDYVHGLPDLRARRVRFVGDPETRIREDVLRLLRFYRFHAQLGREPADPAARAACRLLAPLLPRLSAERVCAELLKLMKAPDPLPTLALMKEDGVLPGVLPEATRTERLKGMLAVEAEPDPIRRLAALVDVDREGALAIARRLKFSNAQRDRLAALVAPPQPVDLAADLRAQRRALYHLGTELYRDLVLMRAAESPPASRRRARALLRFAAKTKRPAFPLKGRDLRRFGLRHGPEVGRVLREVEAWWEAGDFGATRSACLKEAKARIAAQRSASAAPSKMSRR